MSPACNAFVDVLTSLDCLLRRGQALTVLVAAQPVAGCVSPAAWYGTAWLLLLVLGMLGVTMILVYRP